MAGRGRGRARAKPEEACKKEEPMIEIAEPKPSIKSSVINTINKRGNQTRDGIFIDFVLG